MAHLFEDLTAAVAFPLPHLLQKLFASELLFGDPLFEQLLFDDVLCCDPRMVESRLPEGAVAVHPFVAGHDILQRKGQRMADMQHAGDVRRGHHDAEVFIRLLNLFVALDLEVAALFPDFVVALFRIFGVVNRFLITHTISLMIEICVILSKGG